MVTYACIPFTIPLNSICDMSLTVEETMCIVSVIQAVVAKLYKLNQQNKLQYLQISTDKRK
jgi:hypothetical protein